jgi:carbon-monoxide dehydrogenase small subunit
MKVSLNVNRAGYEVEVKPHWTLLKALRDAVGLTGTKEGCGTGECGACTVIADGHPVRSCLMVAAQAAGKEIVTIEGLVNGSQLHPLQRVFTEYGALQCGYCIPGMIMVAKSYLDRVPDPTEEEIREAISGNFCRCTGYVKPVEAILEAARVLREERRV